MDDKIAQYIRFRESSDKRLAGAVALEHKLLHLDDHAGRLEACQEIGEEYVWNLWVRSQISRMWDEAQAAEVPNWTHITT